MANLDDFFFLKKHNTLAINCILFAIYTILLLVSIFTIVTLGELHLNNPTVITLESAYLPVSSVSFPAVAICNINKISKRQATHFTAQLSNLTGLNDDLVLDWLTHIGNLYDFEYNVQHTEVLYDFQNYLNTYNISIISLTKELSTPCEALLKTCIWKSKKVNCTSLFKMRLTFDGYCCTFNYVKSTREDKINSNKQPIRGIQSLEFGLTVIVNNDFDDYIYNTISSTGVKVQIFVPSDFPDQWSGSLVDVPAQAGSENFIEIIPLTTRAVPEVADYPISKRQCLFDSELHTMLEGVYSQSDCNVDCRAQSTMDLCNCIPFTIPTSDDETVCTLFDLYCLNAYKSKWLSVSPVNYKGAHLRRELQDSLRCDQTCYPACTSTLYDVMSSSIQLKQNKTDTIVHVYYPYLYSQLFKQDVVYYWFEILSNFGGVFGLIIGFSLISIIELVVVLCQALVRLQMDYYQLIIKQN